ncbi:MAG: DUF6498-containing protein [Woeseiaceae bacterium]
MTGRWSLILLVAANLLPLAGVFLWDWDVFLLLLLFWCENVIIGLFGIARLVVAATNDTLREGLFLPLFFLVHYGGFMFGHFMVLFGMYSGSFEAFGNPTQPEDYYRLILDNLNWVAVAALFISHGWSFIENYMGGNEYERLSPMQAMGLPYKRMFITHIALILGGFFLIKNGQPLVGLIILVLMKIALDIVFHQKEHRKLGVVG